MVFVGKTIVLGSVGLTFAPYGPPAAGMLPPVRGKLVVVGEKYISRFVDDASVAQSKFTLQVEIHEPTGFALKEVTSAA